MKDIEFVTAIQIGKNITDIFRLPCIAAIRKDIFGAVFYELYGFLMSDGRNAVAREGNWLCENYNSKWKLMTNEEYLEYVSRSNVNA